jgi:hypothetical protein
LQELRIDAPIEDDANNLDPYNCPPIGTPTRAIHIDGQGKVSFNNGGVSSDATSAFHAFLQQPWVRSSPCGAAIRICVNSECLKCFPDIPVQHDDIVYLTYHQVAPDEWYLLPRLESVRVTSPRNGVMIPSVCFVIGGGQTGNLRRMRAKTETRTVDVMGTTMRTRSRTCTLKGVSER